MSVLEVFVGLVDSLLFWQCPEVLSLRATGMRERRRSDGSTVMTCRADVR